MRPYVALPVVLTALASFCFPPAAAGGGIGGGGSTCGEVDPTTDQLLSAVSCSASGFFVVSASAGVIKAKYASVVCRFLGAFLAEITSQNTLAAQQASQTCKIKDPLWIASWDTNTYGKPALLFYGESGSVIAEYGENDKYSVLCQGNVAVIQSKYALSKTMIPQESAAAACTEIGGTIVAATTENKDELMAFLQNPANIVWVSSWNTDTYGKSAIAFYQNGAVALGEGENWIILQDGDARKLPVNIVAFFLKSLPNPPPDTPSKMKISFAIALAVASVASQVRTECVLPSGYFITSNRVTASQAAAECAKSANNQGLAPVELGTVAKTNAIITGCGQLSSAVVWISSWDKNTYGLPALAYYNGGAVVTATTATETHPALCLGTGTVSADFFFTPYEMCKSRAAKWCSDNKGKLADITSANINDAKAFLGNSGQAWINSWNTDTYNNGNVILWFNGAVTTNVNQNYLGLCQRG
ncbi:hypothetical protein BJ742DRAFT_868015 [Cladochytrium replicatum]|nr:hypothetical protein BJ742DRAFT_868015 [Cladochytrium replicatum]